MPGEDINILIRALRNDATSNGLCRVYFGSQSLNLDPCCYAIVLLRRCIRSHAFSGTPRAGKLLSVEVGVDAIPVAGHVNGHGDDGGRVYEILLCVDKHTSSGRFRAETASYQHFDRPPMVSAVHVRYRCLPQPPRPSVPLPFTGGPARIPRTPTGDISAFRIAQPSIPRVHSQFALVQAAI